MPSRLPPFETDLSSASTLPAFAYTDAAILRTERSQIFRRTWQPIGHIADLSAPGTFITGAIDDAPVVVTRDSDGALRGFHNVCRHRAGPVAIGKGARKSLTCKYHGWTYALDGKLMTTPELGDVKNFDKACHGLRPIQATAWGPIVFVNLDLEAEPLSSVLGDIPKETGRFGLESMRLVARKDYDMACKLSEMIDRRLTPIGIGWAIRAVPEGAIPWHRVINGGGGISTDREHPGLQRKLLEAEGVRFDAKGCVDLDKVGWSPLAKNASSKKSRVSKKKTKRSARSRATSRSR
jgi:alkylated DNA nucleotide flippase Atl1/nitrite reductase/ring-hydroxylating ferredoxin subunit